MACCTKEDKDPLPKATQEGKNTFGCKINGKPWVPERGGVLFSSVKPIEGGFYRVLTTPRSVGIWIRTRDNDKKRVHVHLEDIEVGEHLLNLDTQVMPVTILAKDYGMYQVGNLIHSTSSRHTGRVTITKADTLTGIISGTFEFIAASSTGDTVRVTDGRFDINSITL
ncbi:DUF6252 family protein [Persicitalea jodogahamensis]|uniref:Uncharacterized protein n=1 Tax=Persicitalea jodogahamensis TaxID=402147 RepID=A0A8J3GBA3_9BACT|nr:hypothetical protein GCM10007390_46630 [Persicitalea jodogahamensis]